MLCKKNFHQRSPATARLSHRLSTAQAHRRMFGTLSRRYVRDRLRMSSSEGIQAQRRTGFCSELEDITGDWRVAAGDTRVHLDEVGDIAG